jgi:hypothetical protein
VLGGSGFWVLVCGGGPRLPTMEGRPPRAVGWSGGGGGTRGGEVVDGAGEGGGSKFNFLGGSGASNLEKGDMR